MDSDIEKDLVAQYLSEWGLSDESVKNFQENQITFNLLEDIQEFELKELVPSIKERILYKRGLQKLKTIISETASEGSEDMSSMRSSDIISCSSRTSSSSIDLDSTKTCGGQPTDCDERNDLERILKTTSCGELCLGSINKHIDTTMRNNITKTVVEYYIQKYGTMTSRDFDDMSGQITILFPSECKETYYVPSRKYSQKQYIPARGNLVDRYHNKKRTLKKINNSKTGQLKAVDETDTEESGGQMMISTTTTPEEFKEHQLWLKFNKEPFVEILEKWEITRHYRLKDFTCIENTVHDILTEWPSLTTSLGYKLIESDFNVLHPNRGLNLLKKWPVFIDKALPHFKKLKSNELGILDENPSDDARDYVYFKLMAHKMTPTVKVTIRDNDKKKKFFKPSIVESQNAFILHVTNQSEIKNRLEQCQKLHLSRGTTFQPLIIAVGPTTNDLQDFYVAVEHVMYKIETLLKAVDVCFKVIQVLNAEYAVECISVWTFIQKYFYNIDCKSDKKISSVSCFMTDLLYVNNNIQHNNYCSE